MFLLSGIIHLLRGSIYLQSECIAKKTFDHLYIYEIPSISKTLLRHFHGNSSVQNGVIGPRKRFVLILSQQSIFLRVKRLS